MCNVISIVKIIWIVDLWISYDYEHSSSHSHSGGKLCINVLYAISVAIKKEHRGLLIFQLPMYIRLGFFSCLLKWCSLLFIWWAVSSWYSFHDWHAKPVFVKPLTADNTSSFTWVVDGYFFFLSFIEIDAMISTNCIYFRHLQEWSALYGHTVRTYIQIKSSMKNGNIIDFHSPFTTYVYAPQKKH